MIAPRVLAVLAAVFLIGAVALATVGARAMTLDAALMVLDRGFAEGLPGWVSRNLGSWTWMRVGQPLMVRPAWLLPASVGLILAGLAVSLWLRGETKPSRRRGPGTRR